ncbi:hypothetical protein MKW92_008288 [Papaver armeniacum]|nr:hypothetical protein MKW92_008288 [Papaver armeniacum]
MALRNVTRMLSQRWFSTSTRGITGGGTETSKHITDEKLRSLYVSIKQAIAETNQLRDECNTYFALKRAFPQDRVVWLFFISSVGYNSVRLARENSKTENIIEDKRSQLRARLNAIGDRQSQLSARRTEMQKLRLPALSA